MLELWIASLRLCFIGKFSATPFHDALKGNKPVVWGSFEGHIRSNQVNLQRCILHSRCGRFLIILANISSWLVNMRMYFFCILFEAWIIFSNIQIWIYCWKIWLMDYDSPSKWRPNEGFLGHEPAFRWSADRWAWDISTFENESKWIGYDIEGGCRCAWKGPFRGKSDGKSRGDLKLNFDPNLSESLLGIICGWTLG